MNSLSADECHLLAQDGFNAAAGAQTCIRPGSACACQSQHQSALQVLLFCTMTRALDVIEEYLEWRGWRFVRMDGSTPTEERGQLVGRFSAPDSGVFVFLLSIRAGGVGLNLQSADTVVMYDSDYNPQIEEQAQARVHRLGQKNKVRPQRQSNTFDPVLWIHDLNVPKVRGMSILCLSHDLWHQDCWSSVHVLETYLNPCERTCDVP